MPEQIHDGATNMATDRAIAEYACRVGRPTMRLYQWSPSCISIGYHQKTDILAPRQCRVAGIDVVRRPTGGRAVFHAEEWTYSVVIPIRRGGTDRLESVYQMIGKGLVQGLNRLGIPAAMEKRRLNLHSHYRSELGESCFSAAAKYEVVAQGKKLVGSAQRKYSDCILQHGSILTGEAHARLPFYFSGLDSSKRKRMSEVIRNKATCIQSLIGTIPAFEEGADAIRKGMEEVLGVRMGAEELSDNEKSRISDLRPEFSIWENPKESAIG